MNNKFIVNRNGNGWEPSTSAEGLLSSLELMELGLLLQRENITSEETAILLTKWLRAPPPGVEIVEP